LASKKTLADPGADVVPSHARVTPSVEERINHITGMMERLEWQRGKSARVLAEQWGLKVGTVENDSAEASRRVTADADEVRRDITLGGRKLLQKALADDDAKSFATVGKLLADVSGANAPVKQEIAAAVGEISPEVAARLVREAFGTHGAMPAEGGDDAPTDGD
jgi:hypothetical protein